MRIVESCKILCKRPNTKDQLAQFAEKISDEYRVNWYAFGCAYWAFLMIGG